MAVLKNYIPTVHDLYTYTTPAVFHGTSVPPIGYNSQCQSEGHVDWSGTRALNRYFCNKYNPNSFLAIPYDEKNINFWNQCTYGAALVTPRHVLVCQHFRGAHADPNINASNIVFLGRSGKRYNRNAVRVWLNIGPDLTLMELNEDIPADDVKIYNMIADPLYIPKGTHLWTKDSNAKIYRTIFDRAYWVYSTGLINGYNLRPSLDGINDGGGLGGNLIVFVGDSGSPVLVSYRGETVFVGLQYGGQCVNSQTFENIKNAIAESGFECTYIKMSAKPEDINQDGIVDGNDLSEILAKWGTIDNLMADVNGDGIVDGQDLSQILAAWGQYEMQKSVEVIGIPPQTPPEEENKKRRA
jgi:hypothetical protein